jgi:hypothetical protein
MKNVSDKGCRVNKKTAHFVIYILFNRSLYEIMWKNIAHPESPQMTTQRICINP